MKKNIDAVKVLLWALIIFNGIEFIGAFVLGMDHIWIVLANTFMIIGCLVFHDENKKNAIYGGKE